MNKMKNKGLTLAELVITMVIASIVAMTLTVLFISEFRLREKINDEITVAREAEAAIDGVSRVLRFAIPDTVQDGFVSQTYANTLYNMYVKVGHLPSAYPTASSNSIYSINFQWFWGVGEWGFEPGILQFMIANWFTAGNFPGTGARGYNVARHLTNFSIVEDPALPDEGWFIISVTARKNDAEITLNTTIRALGEW